MNYPDVKGQKVVLGFSGGPDAAALAYRLKSLGARVIPVYVNYRKISRGGKTAKDVRAAIISAQSLGISVPLEIRAPLGNLSKSWRNRFFTKTLASVALENGAGIIALGTIKVSRTTNEYIGRATINDLSPEILSRHGKKQGVKVLTWDSFNVSGKAEEFAGIPPEDRQFLFYTTSCQMWWRLECGNCHSCKARHDAFLRAFGSDPTAYRQNSTIMKKN